MVVACGRQVTPNPPGLGAGGAPPGYMTIKFDVAEPFDFTTYSYWIVFNTTGNGLSPDTQPARNNYGGFSDAIEVGGNGGATFATAWQFIHSPTNPGAIPALQNLLPGPLLQYVPDSNGTGTEFTVTFQRAIFKTRATPTPGPGATGSPPPYNTNWTFNAFVVQGSPQTGQLQFANSMGVGGPSDTTWVSPTLPICTNFDNVVYALSSGMQLPGPAQIVSVELANNGSTAGTASKSCPP